MLSARAIAQVDGNAGPGARKQSTATYPKSPVLAAKRMQTRGHDMLVVVQCRSLNSATRFIDDE
jgi:hypothetical protein